MKDLCLKDGRIIELIQCENHKQVLKWGIQDRSPFEWLTFLAEEVGELAAAISDHKYRDTLPSVIVGEAIQVATLAAKIAEMFLNFEESTGEDQPPRVWILTPETDLNATAKKEDL